MLEKAAAVGGGDGRSRGLRRRGRNDDGRLCGGGAGVVRDVTDDRGEFRVAVERPEVGIVLEMSGFVEAERDGELQLTERDWQPRTADLRLDAREVIVVQRVLRFPRDRLLADVACAAVVFRFQRLNHQRVDRLDRGAAAGGIVLGAERLNWGEGQERNREETKKKFGEGRHESNRTNPIRAQGAAAGHSVKRRAMGGATHRGSPTSRGFSIRNVASSSVPSSVFPPGLSVVKTRRVSPGGKIRPGIVAM